jgi:hypothetical protein
MDKEESNKMPNPTFFVRNLQNDRPLFSQEKIESTEEFLHI